MIHIGLIADIHGDWGSFVRAIGLFERERVAHIFCAGDIVERGAYADRIVAALRKLPVTCVKGNHEHTILRAQSRWRTSLRTEQLTRLGRIVGDDTLTFVEALPDTAQRTIAGIRILLAHGTPWSDVLGVFPDSRQSTFDQLAHRYADAADVIVLGHTHRPMCVHSGPLHIFNPGSVYGVTGRDSHTCAILSLPKYNYRVFDLATYRPYDVAILQR